MESILIYPPEDDYLKLPENQIDIALGCLIIEKEIFPDLIIDKELKYIDTILDSAFKFIFLLRKFS